MEVFTKCCTHTYTHTIFIFLSISYKLLWFYLPSFPNSSHIYSHLLTHPPSCPSFSHKKQNKTKQTHITTRTTTPQNGKGPMIQKMAKQRNIKQKFAKTKLSSFSVCQPLLGIGPTWKYSLSIPETSLKNTVSVSSFVYQSFVGCGEHCFLGAIHLLWFFLLFLLFKIGFPCVDLAGLELTL